MNPKKQENLLNRLLFNDVQVNSVQLRNSAGHEKWSKDSLSLDLLECI